MKIRNEKWYLSDFYDETNFPHKLLLTNTQVSKIRKAFSNGSTVNMDLSKTELSKMVQLGKFLSKLLGSLIKTGLHFQRNVLKTLKALIAKSVLVTLGLKEAASGTDVIQKKVF